jgi:hypothetical protein
MELEQIIAKENDKVSQNMQNMNEICNLLDRVFYFIDESFIARRTKESDGYISCYARACVHFKIAVLSLLRNHFSSYCLEHRYAIEYSVLAAYLLQVGWPKIDCAASVEEYADLKNCAYKWISKEFPEVSKNIRDTKKGLNKFGTHANLAVASLTFDYEESISSYFDDLDNFVSKAQMCNIVNSVLLFTNLYVIVNERNSWLLINESASEQWKAIKHDLEKIGEDSVGEHIH